MTTLGAAMGKVAERFVRQFVVLGTVIAVLLVPSHAQGEEPADGTPFLEEQPPLPPAPELASEAGEDQDWTDPAYAQPLLESPAEPGGVEALGTDAPIYPVLREHCRSSRVYRSGILGRLWFRGEYLAWATKGVNLPPLVITDLLDDGIMLFGDQTIHDEMSHGARLTLGFWWDPRQLEGIEASYLGLPVKEVRHYSQGTGDAIIARPFVNVNTGEPALDFVAYPGILDGSIDVRADMELQGAEVLLRRAAVCRPGLRVDMLGGYRFGRLVDRLTAYQQSVSLHVDSGYDPDTIIERFDLFKSTNDFHGGEAGLVACWTRGCWSVELLGKVGLGATDTRVIIDGATSTTFDGFTLIYPGGLLALPSNSGYHRETEVTVLSELGVSLRCQLTCDLSVSAGYNLLHWSRVGRAADQIDLGLDPGQIPPEEWTSETQPAFALDTSEFWAQGLNVRLEHQF